MKKKVLSIFALSLPFFAFSQANQNDNGITWNQGFTWQQIQKKAKKENKYIFVDCYATWCAPCKQMDKDVYSADSVVSYLNANFISVKLQMDSTKSDDAVTRGWYKAARDIGRQYKLVGYPTLLFFSPKGEMVSKRMGYHDAGAFMQLARDAKDPSKQFDRLLKNYRAGKKDYEHMPYLINTAKQINDTVTYKQVLKTYYTYLHSLPKEKLYTNEIIQFVASTLEGSKQIIFDMFFPNEKEVDKAMNNGWYAANIVDKIISKEILVPFLEASAGKAEPDWDGLRTTIRKQYNDEYAGRNVLNAKITWYGSDENALIRATIFSDKIEKYGSDTTSFGEDFKLNNRAFGFFETVTDIIQLKRIIGWMEGVKRRGETATGVYAAYWPLYLDTYANLLYKVGNANDAIMWEQLALDKSKERNIEKGDQKAIAENLKLMKEGKPTWPTN